jgi:chromosome segregation ATPase
MSKLVDISRPGVQETGDDGVVVAMPLPPARTNGAGQLAGQVTTGEGASDGGVARHLDARVEVELQRSEESEALHRLLVDTRRKIDNLDALKTALDDMALPFRGAMRALDQERALSSDLARQLSEKAAACDKLRDELQHAENKVRLQESETESLRDALDKARESSYALESVRMLLSDEVKRRDAKIEALERQLDEEALQRRGLNENYRTLQEQALQAGRRITELQDALVEAGAKCETLKQDKRSLWHSAELARAEAERVNRRLMEGEGALRAIRLELGKVEARHAEICAERNRLADMADEFREQQQAERQQFNGRIGALETRIAAADRQVAELRHRLIERTEEARAYICKTAEATMARASAERRLAALQVSHGLGGTDAEDPVEARTALSEYLRALNLKSREMALASAAEKMADLGARKGPLKTDSESLRTGANKRAEDLAAGFQNDHPRRAEIEKALDAARQANARLESEVASLRSELRDPGGKTEPSKAEPVATERAKSRTMATPDGGLGYQEGLVAQLLRSAKKDDPGRSVA